MKHILKHKFYGKLLNFLKYKRYKKVRTFLSFSKKKIDFNSHINYYVKNRQYFLKKGDLDSFLFDSFPDSSSSFDVVSTFSSFKQPLVNDSILQHLPFRDRSKHDPLFFNENESSSFKLNKKKYKLNSFLFNMLCQFSRGRVNTLLGQEILFRYYTIPYRLSLSRFIGNKVLRSYYINLSKKTFLSLRKSISLKAKRSNHDKKEITKNFLLSLERRLDSSLLRLLHFKPLYTKKYQSFLDSFGSSDFNSGNINSFSNLHNSHSNLSDSLFDNKSIKRQKSLSLDNLHILFKSNPNPHSNFLEKKSF